MDDDFYNPLSVTPSVAQTWGSLSNIQSIIPAASLLFMGTALLALPLIFIAARFNVNTPKEPSDGDRRSIWVFPYTIPIVGHWFQFLNDPTRLMSEARDRSAHSVFALKFGIDTHNIISNPEVVRSLLQKDESIFQPHPTAWDVLHKCFAVPKRSKPKYSLIWHELQSTLEYLLQEPHLSNILKSVIRNLEENIPQMLSFMDSDVDQHSWERFANASFISNSETEIDLMSLIRNMLGTASIPAVFGRSLMEKYPEILHDLYDMDKGMSYFLMGLPAWTPWPTIGKAYLARQRVLQGLDGLQEALDAIVDEKHIDSLWGDLDDVSEFIVKRHAIYKENALDITERADIAVLWALVVNIDLIVFWQLLYILATPGLSDRIRKEIAPYIKVTKPVSIGGFAEAPKLTISHEVLSKNCPLFKASYFEAMRLSARPSSTSKVMADVTITGETHTANSRSYMFRKGEYVTIPHDLHMRDPKYFDAPETFNPERFLVQKNGMLSAEMGTIRPYGAGRSICKGRIFAERACLALVAGVLVCWDIEPVDKKTGWVIPKQERSSAVCRPTHETRVRIKQKTFKWGD